MIYETFKLFFLRWIMILHLKNLIDNNPILIDKFFSSSNLELKTLKEEITW